MNTAFEKSKTFIYRNARPLDLARWQCHFENGGQAPVLSALASYQNADGGFGHALEPDAWNPHSAPIQTWAATEILREIGFEEGGHPLVKGVLRYLESGDAFDGRVWRNTLPSNNDYPHAPWWHTQSASKSHHDYNATACLAGFILRFAPYGSAVYELGLRIAGQAIEHYLDTPDLLEDMHVAQCYVRLWQYAAEASVSELSGLQELSEKLHRQVAHGITRDTQAWKSGYVCMPSHFIEGPQSPYYPANRGLADAQVAFLFESQLEDGSWHIPWEWGAYPESWAISKNWWKSNGIVLNMLYLKAFGQI